MCDDLFPRWTRRGLALIFGSGVASALLLDELDAKRSRRRRRKRRRRKQQQPCLVLDSPCIPGGNQKCCRELQCDQTVVAETPGDFCCQPEGTPCTNADPCCSGTCDFLVDDGTCAPCRGRTCNAERPCCDGLACTDGYCGGCRDRGTSCLESAQCCFSDCTPPGACLSDMGGPCARGADCKSCYFGGPCENACVDGLCTA